MSAAADLYEQKSPSRLHSDWACLVGQGYRLQHEDNAFRKEALGFALRIMARVKEWADRTVEDLQREGYRFAEPDRVLTEPEDGAAEWINDFRQTDVYLPIALEAWLRVVGGINLTGTHPRWLEQAYVYDEQRYRGEPLYTDPLVVELPRDYAVYLYDEWIETRNSGEAVPFRVDVSPDHLHKANVSGGLPYQLSTDLPEVDGILWNERHETSFVGYLRTAIRHRGFPGLDYISSARLGGWVKEDPTFVI